MSSYKVNLRALLQIAPRRSHAFLSILLVLGVIFLLIGCLFLWNDKPHAEIPFGIGFLMVFISIIGWFISHKDIDWDKSLPTTIADGSGLSLTTDTRALVSSSAALQLSQFFSLLAIRKELPTPSGLVDNKLQPISGTEKIAQERTALINQESESLLIQGIQAITKRRQEQLGEKHNAPVEAISIDTPQENAARPKSGDPQQ